MAATYLPRNCPSCRSRLLGSRETPELLYSLERGKQCARTEHFEPKRSMRTMLLLVALALSLAAAEKCHPQCKWQCDDPTCPALCHPVCERPKCQMQCEETTCAKCTVHCEKPVCTIRCPKDQCEKEGCPKCESVCKPAHCHTTCEAPEPKCQPVCEELTCFNKCIKPTNCAKPKCELQCERAACEEPQCCPCSSLNVRFAMTKADEHNNKAAPKPSFIEVMNNLSLDDSNQCCPCTH